MIIISAPPASMNLAVRPMPMIIPLSISEFPQLREKLKTTGASANDCSAGGERIAQTLEGFSAGCGRSLHFCCCLTCALGLRLCSLEGFFPQ